MARERIRKSMGALLRSALRVFILVAGVMLIGALAFLWWIRPVIYHLGYTGVEAIRETVDLTIGDVEYFRIREIEIRGSEILDPDDIVRALDLEAKSSIWTNLRYGRLRLQELPGVIDARVDRRLPGTVVVTLHEAPVVAKLANHSDRVVLLNGDVLAVDTAALAHWSTLPTLELADSVSPENVSGVLAAARNLWASGLSWLTDVEQLEVERPAILIARLRGGSEILLPPGDTPLTSALVDAIRSDRRARGDSTSLRIDLRFNDLIIAQ